MKRIETHRGGGGGGGGWGGGGGGGGGGGVWALFFLYDYKFEAS